jgi:metal-responsive CopG/Arc/MetJ family transcriptional regulator
MKTAISIPDPLFEAAEKAAKKLRMSRSQLYATALAEYLETHQAEAVTEALDRVYGEEQSALDSTLATLQYRSLPRDDW